MKILFYITFAAANLSLVLYGILALTQPAVLLNPFTLHVYRLPDDATRAKEYLAAVFRLIGFFNLVLGVLGLLVLRRLRATREKWYSRFVVLSTTLAYVGPIVFDNTVGTIGPAEIVEHILFVLVVVFGLFTLSRPDAP